MQNDMHEHQFHSDTGSSFIVDEYQSQKMKFLTGQRGHSVAPSPNHAIPHVHGPFPTILGRRTFEKMGSSVGQSYCSSTIR